MSVFIEKAKAYASYHTKPITKITHFIGVPVIVFSLMILFGFVKVEVPNVYSTDVATILTIAALAYYFRLNYKLAAVLTPVFIILKALASLISAMGPTSAAMEVFLVLFILGWIFQFAGHFYEKSRPAFMTNISSFLFAPLFLVAEAFFYFGMMNDLYNEIYGPEQSEIDKSNQKRVEDNEEDM